MTDQNDLAAVIAPQLAAARDIYAKLLVNGQRRGDAELARSDDYAEFLSLGRVLRAVAGKEEFCKILVGFFPDDHEASTAAAPHLLHLWAGLEGDGDWAAFLDKTFAVSHGIVSYPTRSAVQFGAEPNRRVPVQAAQVL